MNTTRPPAVHAASVPAGPVHAVAVPAGAVHAVAVPAGPVHAVAVPAGAVHAVNVHPRGRRAVSMWHVSRVDISVPAPARVHVSHHAGCRRCRTETALGKLAKPRQRVRRFKQVGKTLSKLFSPNLEKGLTFLDNSLLPSTSNAVERGFRRHRKMQKTVYRLRTQANIIGRIALDMQRDAHTATRKHTIATLHRARAG